MASLKKIARNLYRRLKRRRSLNTAMSEDINVTESPDLSGLASNPDAVVTSAELEPVTTSQEATFDGCWWHVHGTGNFKNMVEYTFETGAIPPGLRVSNWPVKERLSPYHHFYQPCNVFVDPDGCLNLKVPGGQNPEQQNGCVYCAEVGTVEQQILYGSVRTLASFSDVPGTCHGLFFYKSDQQEVDIEYVSDPTSLSNPGCGKPPILYFTNQATQVEGQPTEAVVEAPQDVTEFHEYRIDWCPFKTKFYIDGKLQAGLLTNVPTQPGQWMWNNWSNGDPGWSCGPPAKDNIMKIKKITMYYNLAEDLGDPGMPSV